MYLPEAVLITLISLSSFDALSFNHGRGIESDQTAVSVFSPGRYVSNFGSQIDALRLNELVCSPANQTFSGTMHQLTNHDHV